MKSLTAADLMTRNVVTVAEDTSVVDAIALLIEHGVGSLPVVDSENHLLGIVSAYDLMNFAHSGEADRSNVAEAMTRTVCTLHPEAEFEVIVNWCLSERMHRMPVVEDNKLVGIVSRKDLLQGIVDLYRKH